MTNTTLFERLVLAYQRNITGPLMQSTSDRHRHTWDLRNDLIGGLQLSPTHHHEQRCNNIGVIQAPGHHHHAGPEVG